MEYSFIYGFATGITVSIIILIPTLKAIYKMVASIFKHVLKGKAIPSSKLLTKVCGE